MVGHIIKASEVYNSDGLTLMIDDFCVVSSYQWLSVGKKLVTNLKPFSQDKGAKQILVSCGTHDEPKCQFLKNLGHTITSEWYVGRLA